VRDRYRHMYYIYVVNMYY